MTLHAYQVGFGDCFLLAFHYKSARDRHVLIDFGSTGLPKTAPKNQLTLIAQDIASVCGGVLDAVVLSHRHKDHMRLRSPATRASAEMSDGLVTVCPSINGMRGRRHED